MTRRVPMLFCLSLSLLAMAPLATQAQIFQLAHATAAIDPIGVAVGDFNGDHKQDIVTTDHADSVVDVLLSNGNGTFAPAVPYSVASGPSSVAVGDFNHDGKLDLAVATSQGLDVLLGNGDGTFRPAVLYPFTAGQENVIEVGDFNRDGNLDAVIATSQNELVHIFLGNGDGTFQPAVQIASDLDDIGITSFAVADFNGDGKLDLAYSNIGNGIDVLLGNGDGTFQTAVSYKVEQYAYAVVAADFNGDGKVDLAVLQCGPKCDKQGDDIGLLYGNGDGTFQNERNLVAAAEVNATVMTTADVNGDGKPDLIVANYLTNDVSVFLNIGTGFGPMQSWVTGQTPIGLATGDFNGDGKIDLAAGNAGSNTVSVLIGNGTGKFSAPRNIRTPGSSFSVAVGDYNEDGKLDLAIANYNLGTVSVLLATPNGNYAAPVTYTIGGNRLPQVFTADFNNDHHLDLVTLNATGTTFSVLLGTGTGTFGTPVSHSTGLATPMSLVVGDFNQDGNQDVAFCDYNGSVSVLLGKGDGTFQTPVVTTSPAGAIYILAGDFNGDGKLDVAVTQNGTTLYVMLGNGNGTFQAASAPYTVGNYPQQGVVADLNHDGKLDLAILSVGYGDPHGTVSVLIGNGDGTFQPATNYPVGNEPQAVAVADFNNDGNPDLIVSSWQTDRLPVFLGNGDGTFRTGPQIVSGHQPLGFAVADLNGDGKPDLAVTNENSGFAGTLSIFLNN
ncbi:MAG: VCBS repeat-containing protein [Candidatus Sulfotelmatobacter sp.]